MDTAALSAGQIVYTPPTHLEKHKTNDEQHKRHAQLSGMGTPEMNVDQIAKPRDGGPGFFWIPAPIVPPCFLSPQRAKKHADSQNASPI